MRVAYSWQITALEFGVQTTVDAIHDFTKRDSSRAQVIEKTQLAKEFGFKVMAHIMPDLPGSSPELDKVMIDDILHGGVCIRNRWSEAARSMVAIALPCLLAAAVHALNSTVTGAALVMLGLILASMVEAQFGYEYLLV